MFAITTAWQSVFSSSLECLKMIFYSLQLSFQEHFISIYGISLNENIFTCECDKKAKSTSNDEGKRSDWNSTQTQNYVQCHRFLLLELKLLCCLLCLCSLTVFWGNGNSENIKLREVIEPCVEHLLWVFKLEVWTMWRMDNSIHTKRDLQRDTIITVGVLIFII